MALEKPVLAIVPGYGVADVVLQGLGGWFAFGLHDFLSSKTLIQTGLATAAPDATVQPCAPGLPCRSARNPPVWRE